MSASGTLDLANYTTVWNDNFASNPTVNSSIFGVKCLVVPPMVGVLQLIVRLIVRLQSRRDDDCGGEPLH